MPLVTLIALRRPQAAAVALSGVIVGVMGTWMELLIWPRVLLALAALVLAACGASTSGPTGRTSAAAPSTTATPSASLATYADAATGVSFQVPAQLFVTPATSVAGGTTTQAIFATYDRSQTQVVDLSRELVITASVVARQPNEDLHAFAARNLQGSGYSVSDVPRLQGIIIDGTFQTGRRKYLLVPKTADAVLLMDASPTTSSRIGLFDVVLATLQVK